MKGSLEKFKSDVYDRIKSTYASYKEDFQITMGYLPYEQKKAQEKQTEKENVER